MKINGYEIKPFANLHGANLSGANLSGANLNWVNLSGADLHRADLYRANLYGANLRGANLYGVNLSGADLRGANLSGANLNWVNLSGADLSGADLYGANLYRANLYGANLYGVSLSGADLTDCKGLYYSHIPEEGSFVGWKKINNHLIKLQIPAKAKRTSSIIGRKCRCEFAKVIKITNIQTGKEVTSVTGGYKSYFTYTKNAVVYPDKYNDDPRLECTNGIHFFITKQEAIDY